MAIPAATAVRASGPEASPLLNASFSSPGPGLLPFDPIEEEAKAVGLATRHYAAARQAFLVDGRLETSEAAYERAFNVLRRSLDIGGCYSRFSADLVAGSAREIGYRAALRFLCGPADAKIDIAYDALEKARRIFTILNRPESYPRNVRPVGQGAVKELLSQIACDVSPCWNGTSSIDFLREFPIDSLSLRDLSRAVRSHPELSNWSKLTDFLESDSLSPRALLQNWPLLKQVLELHSINQSCHGALLELAALRKVDPALSGYVHGLLLGRKPLPMYWIRTFIDKPGEFYAADDRDVEKLGLSALHRAVAPGSLAAVRGLGLSMEEVRAALVGRAKAAHEGEGREAALTQNQFIAPCKLYYRIAKPGTVAEKLETLPVSELIHYAAFCGRCQITPLLPPPVGLQALCPASADPACRSCLRGRSEPDNAASISGRPGRASRGGHRTADAKDHPGRLSQSRTSGRRFVVEVRRLDSAEGEPGVGVRRRGSRLL